MFVEPGQPEPRDLVRRPVSQARQCLPEHNHRADHAPGPEASRRFDSVKCRQVAEGQGFEPWMPFDTPVFKTGAFNRSATPPLEVAIIPPLSA